MLSLDNIPIYCINLEKYIDNYNRIVDELKNIILTL